MTVLPCHADLTMPDPLSICEEDWELEEVPKWKLITSLLKRHGSGTSSSRDLHPPLQYDITASAEEHWKILKDILTTFQPSLSSCDTLRQVLTSEGRTIEQFMKHTFPAMISLALRMPELFPTGVVPILHPGVDDQVSFTREQVACILVHMFLCTIQPAKWNKFWVNFSIWYSSTSKPVLAYLHTLITYFEQLDDSGAPPSPSELVTFQRCVLHQYPNWESSKAELVQVTPSSDLEPFADIEVDFANKDVGFGVSGSQEEAKLAQSPETCIVMLLAPTLQDDEALVIHGARKVAKFTGIGRNISFTGIHPIHSDAWTSRAIIAIDSLELDEEQNDSDAKPIAELREKVLNRELNKAFCGFSSVRTSQGEAGSGCPVIATGHWGCGAFGGNRETKALIQVMAATENDVSLVFHDITVSAEEADKPSDFLTRLINFLKVAVRRGVTVGVLYKAMLHVGLQFKFGSDLFSELVKYL